VNRCVLSAGVAIALLACLGAQAADPQPLELRIRNDTATPLRCVLLLAHWYSEDLDPIAPGGIGSLALESGLPDGTVVRRNSLGRAMAVEGLQCLSGDAATAERAAVPLDALRHATGTLLIGCRRATGFGCGVAAGSSP
jgi:hypothetical protein